MNFTETKQTVSALGERNLPDSDATDCSEADSDQTIIIQ